MRDLHGRVQARGGDPHVPVLPPLPRLLRGRVVPRCRGSHRWIGPGIGAVASARSRVFPSQASTIRTVFRLERRTSNWMLRRWIMCARKVITVCCNLCEVSSSAICTPSAGRVRFWSASAVRCDRERVKNRSPTCPVCRVQVDAPLSPLSWAAEAASSAAAVAEKSFVWS